MGDSIEAVPEGTPEPESVSVVDFNEFCNYIRKVVTVLLPNVDVVPPALNAALQDRNNQDCIRKFISDPQVPVLFIQRTSTKGTRPSLLFISRLRHLCCQYAYATA